MLTINMKKSQLNKTIHDITYKSQERNEIFSSLKIKQQATVFLRLSKHIKSQLLLTLPEPVTIPLLEYLDPDDTTDALQLLPQNRQKALLSKINEEVQKDIELLLQFDPRTAAGIMSLNYTQIEADRNLREVSEKIQTHEKRTGKIPLVLVMEEGKLQGYVPLQRLIYGSPDDKVKGFTKKINIIRHNTSSKDVMNHFLDNPHESVVVLGDDDAILGVVYADDIIRIVQENQASTLYDFAGVKDEETIYVSTKQKFRFRYKWLIINLATAFFASFVVGLFDNTISKYVLLAVYMPVVAGMGGNAATQTLAVLVRGIALKQITLGTAWPTLRKEAEAALVNGIINGALVACVVIFFNRDMLIAFILATAMIANMIVAAFFGTLIPLIMVKMKKDPASSATIFITTATDVLGFLIFLGLATMILR